MKAKVGFVRGGRERRFGVAVAVEGALGVHVEGDDVVGDEAAGLLVLVDDVPDDVGGSFFDFGRHHTAGAVFLGDFF